MQTSKTPLEVAAAILTKRAQTRAELRRKLLKREEFTVDVVEEALTKLEEMGFLSDRRYTEDFVRIMRERSYGDRRIMEKLLFKGVDKELVEEILHADVGNRDPFDDAMALLERRARKLDRVDDPQKRNQRILCMLAGRGFSPEIAYRAIKAWSQRPKNEED